MKRHLETLRRAFVAFLLAPIRLYQRFISPAMPRRCKYEPTCSAYAVSAVSELGVVRGTILAGWRLLRCNPFSHGGWDPVRDRTLFRAPEADEPSTHTHEAHA